jgi:predicted transcriptional regulator
VQPAREVDAVVLYATAPQQQVVGWFDVDGVENAAPSTLWRRYGGRTSLTRREFDDYFLGCEKGVAIRVGEIHRLPTPVALRTLGDLVPPQGFAYLADDALAVLKASARVSSTQAGALT